MKNVSFALLGAAGLWAIPQARAAVMLPPGSSVTLTPSDVDPVPNAAPLTTFSSPFATSLFSGDLVTTVFNNDPANPFGSGALTFAYSLANYQGLPLFGLGFGGWAASPMVA